MTGLPSDGKPVLIYSANLVRRPTAVANHVQSRSSRFLDHPEVPRYFDTGDRR
ncbi:hypothetical protein D3C85_1704710 [compost metagenome]